jgi:hypothetical protein
MNRYDDDDRDWADDYEPEPEPAPEPVDTRTRTLAICAAWVVAFIAAMTYLVRRYA